VSNGAAVSWEDALAELETRLDVAAALVEHAGGTAGAGAVTAAPVAPFRAPAVAGSLPPALADRARALLTRGEAVERALEAERDRIRAELRRLPRRPTRL
jgi:hypothetical protein